MYYVVSATYKYDASKEKMTVVEDDMWWQNWK